VLTIARTAPGIVRRLSIRTVPAGLPALALCLLVTWTAITAWQGWMPGGPIVPSGLHQPAVSTTPTTRPPRFTTALPDGSYPRAAPASLRHSWFPTDPIRKDVASVLGATRRTGHPVDLRATVRLRELAPAISPVGSMGAAGTNTDWPRQITLPCGSFPASPTRPAFSAAAATHRVRPVDVFILSSATQPGTLDLAAVDAPTPRHHLHAHPVQPSTPSTIFTNLLATSCWPSGSHREMVSGRRTRRLTGLTAFSRTES